MNPIANKTDCPNEAVLHSLLDGTLPAADLAAIQTHVDACPRCEAALRQMTAGGESWVGVAARLKEPAARVGDQSPMTAAMDRLKNGDDLEGKSPESVEPQRVLDFLSPSDDPKSLGRLGQHEVLEVVGWGGMGVVLKAYDPSLHRVVAVKVLSSHLAHHAVARKRFIREAQAAAAVCHDNVVTIHAIEDGSGVSNHGITGERGGVSPLVQSTENRGADTPRSPMSRALPKIVMQYVAGGSLQERIDADGPLEVKEVLRIAMQAAAGLAAAHAQGVVHRDVKPANILLENGVERVKLTDFGLARVMDDASLTLSGVIAGTPQYMAPEQAWGRDVDARADLFSLGAVMYAMCSGHSPFRARTTMAVLKRVCEEAPRPLRAINPDVPEWLVAIIEKLLAKNPDDRFQSASEVSELLSRWLAHVQQPTVVPAPEFVVPPSGGTNRVPAPESSRKGWGENVHSTPFDDSGRAARSPSMAARLQLPARFVTWPLIVMWVLLGAMFAILFAESGTRNVASFLGLSLFQLLATFVLASVFRTTWNSSSWVVWIASLLFLPLAASLFTYGATYRDAAVLTQWLNALQALSAIAYWLGLLFVRPLFVQESDPRRTAPPFRWRRVLAVSGLLVVPLMALILLRMNYSLRQPIRNSATSATEIVPTDLIFTAPVRDPREPQRDPRKPQFDERGFPKAQLLSDTTIPSKPSSNAPAATEFASPTTPADDFSPLPASQVETKAVLQADSLKPLLGRWVVLTLQGDKPPMTMSSAGGAGMSIPGGMRAAAPSSAATPMQLDQLRSLEFRDQSLILNDSENQRLRVWGLKDHILKLTTNKNGTGVVRHGIFTVEGDRLVICWGPSNQPTPRGFQPSDNEQLVVCRREWSRPRQTDAAGNDAVEELHENSKLPRAEMPFSSREAAELQSAWAEKSKSPVEVTNSIGMKLRVIPPGRFGDPKSVTRISSQDFDSGNPEVLRGPILVGVHEVTVAQFRQFVEDSKYVTVNERAKESRGTKTWKEPGFEQDSDRHPVTQVTALDAQAFCHWLSLKEQRPYRLLTRREWEFCARAGTWLPFTLRPSLDGSGKVNHRSQVFWTTAPVGSYDANDFGLHDFIGNVAEWNWSGQHNPDNFVLADPHPLAMRFALCGGDFRQSMEKSQPDTYSRVEGSTRSDIDTGFRVAVDLTPQTVVLNGDRELQIVRSPVRIRRISDAEGKPDQSTEEVVDSNWIEAPFDHLSWPYPVTFLDFEIQRNSLVIKDNKVVALGWKPIPLQTALDLLEQTAFDADILPTEFTDPVITMPIPKAVGGSWSHLKSRPEFPTAPHSGPDVTRPKYFRFIDFAAPDEPTHYRVRFVFQIPGFSTPFTSEWIGSNQAVGRKADDPFDSGDTQSSDPDMPTIELKRPNEATPDSPADPASQRQGFKSRR